MKLGGNVYRARGSCRLSVWHVRKTVQASPVHSVFVVKKVVFRMAG